MSPTNRISHSTAELLREVIAEHFSLAQLQAQLGTTYAAIGDDTGLYATDDDTRDQLADLAADEAQTLEAVRLLRAGGIGAYDAALGVLRDDTRTWWHQVLVEPDADREPYSADPESLIRFLREDVA